MSQLVLGKAQTECNSNDSYDEYKKEKCYLAVGSDRKNKIVDTSGVSFLKVVCMGSLTDFNSEGAHNRDSRFSSSLIFIHWINHLFI